jgi:very-short-patch-repair endonuclease
MKLAFGFIVVFLIVLIFLNAARKLKPKASSTDEHYVAKPLLTENEKAWFKAIRAAVPHAHVFAQVALNQLVRAEGQKFRSAQNRIDPRSLDFVLLNPDLAVLLAIEIDDKSHNSQKPQAADASKDKALHDAEITLLRFPATPVLSEEEIKRRVVEAIAAKAKAPSRHCAADSRS